MAVVRKSQVASHIYYRTILESDCECAHCRKPLWRKLSEDETAVHWMLSGYDLFLHDDCAVGLCVSLLNDAKNSQAFNEGKLQHTVKRLNQVLGAKKR